MIFVVSIQRKQIMMQANRKFLPISVIILTFNEEANIGACLESVTDWCDDLWLVDSGSTDRTLAIAATYTKQIASHSFENYASQRNWAQTALPLKHQWVLHLDADERITPELRTSIQNFFAKGLDQQINGAIFSRRTMFMGRWIKHGGHYPVYHTRLFHRGKGHCEERLYDQHFVVKPPVKKLEGDLIDILTSDLDTWSQRHIRWAGLEAEENFHVGPQTDQVIARLNGNPIERRRWLRTKLFGRVPLFARAFGYFFYRYIMRRGFLDGTEGLIFHFLQACWFRFYVDAKIWEMRRFD